MIARQRMASAMNLPNIASPIKKDKNDNENLNTSSASARRKKLQEGGTLGIENRLLTSNQKNLLAPLRPGSAVKL